MFVKNSQWLYKISSGKTFLLITITYILFFSITMSLLPMVIPASESMVSLDDPVCYTPQEIFNIMDDWSPIGRIQQLWFHMTWDVIVPICSYLVVGTGLSWLLKRAFAPDSKWRLLNLVAMTTVFDLLENFSLAGLVLSYDQHLLWLAWIKNAFTMIKYGSGILILGVLLVGMILAIKNRFKVR